MHNAFEGVTANVSNLQSENETLLKKRETLSSTHAETSKGLVKDDGETRENLWKKVGKYRAFSAKVGKQVKGLPIMGNMFKANEEKIQELKSQVALD